MVGMAPVAMVIMIVLLFVVDKLPGMISNNDEEWHERDLITVTLINLTLWTRWKANAT